MEKCKTFIAIEILSSQRGNISDCAKEIDNALNDKFETWLQKNPEIEVVKTVLQSHLGVVQANSSSSLTYRNYGPGWVAYCITLFVRYKRVRITETSF